MRESKRNSPYVLSDDLISGVFEVKVDEIHDDSRRESTPPCIFLSGSSSSSPPAQVWCTETNPSVRLVREHELHHSYGVQENGAAQEDISDRNVPDMNVALVAADKSTIVDEVVNYIKTLQQTLQKLQTRKLEILHGFNSNNPSPSIFGSQKLNAELTTREAFLADHHQGSSGALASFIGSSSAPPQPPAFQTWTSPNVILNVCGDDAQISLCCPKKPGLLQAICFVLEKHKIEVVSAQVSSNHHRTSISGAHFCDFASSSSSF
nr:transcription factor bHLH95-like [Ipomoea batatas]